MFLPVMILFTISVLIRFKSENLSNLFIFISIFCFSLYWKFILYLHNFAMLILMKTVSETGEKLRQKAIEQKNGILKETHFKNALKNWEDYNIQVVFFSLVFYYFQNIELNNLFDKSLMNDKNIFWLFIQICLYSVIFSQIKINETIKNSRDDNQINQSSYVKNVNSIILFLCIILLLVKKLIPSLCFCYSNVASIALLLWAYSNQFKIELFWEASKMKNNKGKTKYNHGWVIGKN